MGPETTHSWDEHLDVITFKFFWSPQLDPDLPSLKWEADLSKEWFNSALNCSLEELSLYKKTQTSLLTVLLGHFHLQHWQISTHAGSGNKDRLTWQLVREMTQAELQGAEQFRSSAMLSRHPSTPAKGFSMLLRGMWLNRIVRNGAGGCAPGQTRSCYITLETRERHTCGKRRHPSILAYFNCCPNFVVEGTQSCLQWNGLPEGWCWPWADCAGGEDRRPPGRQLCRQRPPQWVVAMALVPAQWLLPMAERASFPTSHSPPLSGWHLQWLLIILTKLVVLNGAKPAGSWDLSSKRGPVKEARGDDGFASCLS